MFRFVAELWRHDGDAAWHFITLPAHIAAEITAQSGPRRGFGSVRVRASVAATSWTTSVFPDSKRDSYVLPVKKEVRRIERLTDGDRVPITLEVLDG